jgi:hypothetical protein
MFGLAAEEVTRRILRQSTPEEKRLQENRGLEKQE